MGGKIHREKLIPKTGIHTMTAPRQENLTQLMLKTSFTYDEASGKFYRGGTEAKCRVNPKGYLQVSFNGKMYMVHRLAWLYVHGTIPDGFLDHINGDPSDNRISNLRLATRSQNEYNKGPKHGKLSPYKGVSRNKGKWCARIRTPNGRLYLGSFATEEEAHLAYCEAAKVVHGEFYRGEKFTPDLRQPSANVAPASFDIPYKRTGTESQ